METDIFKEEAYDLLDDIEATLLELKDAPADRELINRLFRAFHTIKGSGAMFGFKAVAEFTHELETAIDNVREGTGVFPDELTEVLLSGRDQILRMIDAPDPADAEIQAGAQAVLAMLAEATNPTPTAVLSPQPLATPTPEPDVAAPAPQPEPPPPARPNPQTQALIDEIAALLAEVRQMLLGLRDKPDSTKLLKRLYRSLHTASGTAAMYDMESLAEFSGTVATAIDTVRNGGNSTDQTVLTILDTALTHCFALLKSPDPSAQLLRHRSSKILAELEAGLPGETAPAAAETEPLRVLIVEDEFVSRYLLQEFLSPYGSSHVAIDGFEAVLAFKNALTEKKPYHLVCLDIMMPGMDGRQVAQEIRRLETEKKSGVAAKVVMTTAVTDPQIKEELLASGHCDAYLNKPLSFEDLTELLEGYFPGSRPAAQ